MGGRKHLFLALSRKGWGETSLGIEVARQVRDTGDSVLFIAHSGGVPALTGSGFDVEVVPDHFGPLIELLLEEHANRSEFISIVLCDLQTTDYTLSILGMEPERILGYDLPIIALDTWEYDLTGSAIDIFGTKSWHIGAWVQQVKNRLVPVPIGRPGAPGAYCGLPSPVSLARSVRRHIRQNLGLAETDRAVLFCTARWQHGIQSPHGGQLTTAVPQLLWTYLAQVDPAVRLIHIGPEELRLEGAGERYLWMPSMTPDDFDRLLGSVDMYLSTNISAATIGRAIASGLPVLVVQNSCSAGTASQAETMIEGGVSAAVRTWLDCTVPLYPFSLWPLGYWEFLRPLLEDNPYCRALNIVELLHEARFVDTCRRLLFDARAREEVVARHAAYVSEVKQLPTAAQLIDEYLQ